MKTITTTYLNPKTGNTLRVTGNVEKGERRNRFDDGCEPSSEVTKITMLNGIELPVRLFSDWMVAEMEQELLTVAFEAENETE